MARQRVRIDPGEDLSSVPSNLILKFTSNFNSSSREIRYLWPTHAPTDVHAYTSLKIIKINLFEHFKTDLVSYQRIIHR